MTVELHEQSKLAAEAYIYGYPFVYCNDELAKFPAGKAIVSGVHSFNEWALARELLGPEATFVSPNNDTLYAIAVLDLSQGPLLLHVPDTHGRYYVLQLVDAWTNNFAYIGRRATGTAEVTYLLAPWGWEGVVPAQVRDVVHVPTSVAVIVGRIQVDGEADAPAVHALQDEFTLTPLAPPAGPLAGIPAPDQRVRGDLVWWEKLRVELAAFPPPAEEAPMLEMLSQFGLTATESPYVDPDPQLAATLIAGAKAGQIQIEELLKTAGAQPVNGWRSAAHLFDFNRYRLGLGTIDAPAWKIAEAKTAYVTRAVAARAGLWGNHGYEADYFLVSSDADDQPLSGARRYELRLQTPPPVDAFWSLTMYDEPDYHLVANPIARYSIGDRTPGLVTAADGSLTLYLQQDSPGPGKEANWLPSPGGRFRPIMRMYAPKQAILEGGYVLPAIVRVA